jgi:hypothetical protein
MPENLEVLSALLDGDGVDIGELEVALDDPEGRRALVDFVRIRQTAAADDTTPRREFSERALEALTLRQRINARGLPFPVAAAAILIAMLLGSLLNLDLIRSSRATDSPPEPARVLRFEPGVDWQQ